ncbi:branched-chain amino acid transport system permease protein [Halogranum gelatinilyticum]|uniref:Branched-chain amino acid transport system permease protein n=1 Tax=Halogranum gelatinilyticum TaxID=660521 RepID=A0A1G9SV73_9EURY|nr:branched-chain amino acid ABC transporter permease [Halogranum gelatinilyticum]SDM39369.1 branched-chain amino acid transport system permease protein [Halogranum gelatinilyticum]
MSVLDRFLGDDTTEEKTPLQRVFSSDAAMVVGLLLAVYAVFVVIGTILGYNLNGQVNALARLTFLTAVYSLVVLALNLHWGYTGLFNIGVAGFMAVGTYTMMMVSAAPDARVPGLGLPLWVGMIAGMAAASLIGLIAALPALRLRADYLAIVTIAFSEIIRISYLSSTLQSFTIAGTELGTGGGGGIGIQNDPDTVILEALNGLPGIGGLLSGITNVAQSAGVQPTVINNWIYAVVLLVFVVGFYWLLSRISNSPFGRVLKAIREDEDVARALGKNTNLFKIKAFMVGCALMGLGGILWQGSRGFVNPNSFLPQVTFFIWIALIIGGAGSNTGSVVGAALFAAVLFEGPRYIANVASQTLDLGRSPQTFAAAVGALFDLEIATFFAYALNNIAPLRLVLVGVVLIWLMQNRPEGLLGHRKESASSIPLGRPAGKSVAADGGESDE